LLALCLAAGAGSAAAATFPDLYTVTVDADRQACDTRATTRQRADLARDGMAALLTRITGRQQAASYPEISELLTNAPRLMISCGAPTAGRVRVGFNASAVNETLTALDWPIWGAERPLTLVWLAVDFGDGQRAELRAAPSGRGRSGGPSVVVGDPSDPLPAATREVFDSIAADVLAAADERGLPVVLPQLDTEDRRLVRFADVWGGFDPFVVQAAERYNADAVLIGRVRVTEAGYSIRWTLQRADRRESRMADDLRAGVDWLADQFAAQYTTVGGARSSRITVQGITTWPDYGRVIEYLGSVSIVSSVDVESVSQGQLQLRVEARGDEAQLRQYLTLDGVLEPPPDAGPDFGDGVGAAPDALVFVPSWLSP